MADCSCVGLQAALGSIQEFDLITGCKLGGTDGSLHPVRIAYSLDGGKLVALLQVCQPAICSSKISLQPCMTYIQRVLHSRSAGSHASAG